MAQDKTTATSKTFAIVLNIPKEKSAQDLMNALQPCLDLLANNYYYILHDRDMLDNGTPKAIHIHIVLDLEQRTSKAQLLDILSNKLSINVNCISIEICKNKTKMIQYLRHFNNPEKANYELKEIITNDNKLPRYFITDETIEQALLNCTSTRELLNTIGLDNTNKYRNVFNDLLKNNTNEIKIQNEILRHQNYMMQQRIKELEKQVEELKAKKQ